jgi:hypothetical protein
MPRRVIVGIGLLILTTGCLASGMMGRAADLPQTRPLPAGPSNDVMIPVLHPPDALTMAREPHARWVTRLDAALVRAAPVVDLSLFALLIAF